LMLRAEEAWERGRAELKYKIENSEREISILIHQLQNEIDLRSEETRKRILLTQQLDEVNQHLSEYLKKISSFEQQLSEERKRTEDITTQLNLLRSENQVLKEAIKRYQIFESELSSLLSAKP